RRRPQCKLDCILGSHSEIQCCSGCRHAVVGCEGDRSCVLSAVCRAVCVGYKNRNHRCECLGGSHKRRRNHIDRACGTDGRKTAPVGARTWLTVFCNKDWISKIGRYLRGNTDIAVLLTSAQRYVEAVWRGVENATGNACRNNRDAG